MYICIYVYMYICIYVYMYICIYVYMYVCIYVSMSVYIYIEMTGSGTVACEGGFTSILLHVHRWKHESYRTSIIPSTRSILWGLLLQLSMDSDSSSKCGRHSQQHVVKLSGKLCIHLSVIAYNFRISCIGLLCSRIADAQANKDYCMSIRQGRIGRILACQSIGSPRKTLETEACHRRLLCDS